MTELDKKLQELALKDWEEFVITIGEKNVIKAKICIMRQGNHSYGQIKNSLGVTYKQARYGCTKCEDTESSEPVKAK